MSEDRNSTESEDSEVSLTPNFEMPTKDKLDKDFGLKFIPEFSGNRDNLHRFLSCCDVVDGDLSPADSTMLLNIIKCKLSGPAYSVVKYKTFENWSELKKILLEQFLERRTLAQIQTERVNCRQGPGEDVRTFSNKIERLLADLNDACVLAEGKESSEIIESLNGKTALKAFVDGLQNPIRLIIKACRFQKLSEAIEAAVEEERSSYQLRTTNKVSNLKCSFCHKSGHVIANCYLKSSSSLPKFSSPNNKSPVIKREPSSPSYKVNVIVCSYCKNRGHHIKECRKRAYNENKKKQSASSSSTSETSRPGNVNNSGANGGAIRAEDIK